MDPVVSIKGLTKSYGSLQAVQSVDLAIGRGEIFALLGPNGAGKSTTVEILEGHRRRDGGEVTVLGEDPGRAGRRWRERIGIVLQTSNDTAEVTVREVVRHFATFYPRPRNPDELIEQVGLGAQRHQRVGRLSGGQRRRVDVALGLVGDPELLFLDEPTTGFDPEARRRFWELIKGLQGTTILLTTHYLDEAEALADRVAVIARGRIVAEGDPRTLGGRSGGRATVSWAEGSVRTDSPTATVTELAGRYGGEVPGLQVVRPTLEDTYLELIGASR
ncbi:ABC transporter ATP-binding protein [Nonomuraea soli]|uniref:ABC-2 type transport system ATP-binding protein n=1 Tax=Nonomuraea soli TaxID=1032476 RepID=A0A7W0CL34_9ACTN|nr:ABC transporter ATP-binding protein [Nonomuraea soli]MBA2893071.1 ABC-2 type transport system ATP-binding protein [Nonomuraea soli]